MHETVDAGDHIILIGKVVRYDHEDRTPLGYCQGAYVSFGVAEEILQSSGSHGNLCVGIIVECEEKILMYSEDGFDSVALPTAMSIGDSNDEASLLGKLNRLGIDSRLPFVFAVYESGSAQNVYYRDEISKTPNTDLIQTTASDHLTDHYRWFGFDEIPWAQIRDSAVQTMLTRYVDERRNNAFGIYVGNAQQGQIHVPNQGQR